MKRVTHNKYKTPNKIFNKLDKPHAYTPLSFGLSNDLSGRGIKISILDSGHPDHPDIKKIIECINITGDNGDKTDKHGHSTMISGIIGSKNPQAITGISPESSLYFAKVVTKEEECQYNSLVAGVLWSIVKKVDIILMCLGSETDYPVLHDVIRKAYEQNICIIAADGISDVDEYPASYPEVLAIGGLPNKCSRSVQLVLPEYECYTTYLGGSFAKAVGTSLHAAIGAGLAALLIEKDKKNITPNSIYSKLSQLSYRSK